MMTIRSAVREDVDLILSFIKELASYEKLEHKVVASLEDMEYWLFDQKKGEVVLCCVDGRPIGFALYFYTFSTWEGCAGLYIEDIFIQSPYRGKGYGKALIRHVCSLATEQGCKRVEWVCLDWNEPSIEFYKSLGAYAMDGWSTYRLSGDALEAMGK